MKLASGANSRIEFINGKDEEFLVDSCIDMSHEDISNKLDLTNEDIKIIRILKKTEGKIREIQVEDLTESELSGIMEALVEKEETLKEDFFNRVDLAMKRDYTAFENEDDEPVGYEDFPDRFEDFDDINNRF